MEDFWTAARNGNLERIRQLIETENQNIDELRVIDFLFLFFELFYFLFIFRMGTLLSIMLANLVISKLFIIYYIKEQIFQS